MPNTPHIKGLWHSTAMAPDYDRLYGPLQRLFGAVVMHDHVSHEPAIGRRGGMVWIGDNSIELGAPVGDTSPVRNFVERWGGGMHSLAFQVDDAPATAKRLESLGVKAAAFVSDQIFFSHPSGSCGLMLEWASDHTDDDPRWGHPLRKRVMAPVVEVEQYAFVTAVVDNPAAVAARLVELLGTDIVRSNPGAGPDEVAVVISLVDCLLLLFPLPAPGTSNALWGSDITRSRFHAHGLKVPDLAAACSALEEVGVRVAKTIDGLAYLDPDAVSVPTFLVDELLPEDPRR